MPTRVISFFISVKFLLKARSCNFFFRSTQALLNEPVFDLTKFTQKNLFIYLKALVTKRLVGRYFNYVKAEVNRLVAFVAGIGE